MRILINDRIFPNKYSTWRNEEILFFLNQKDIEVDILVYKIEEFAGIKFDFDYDFFLEELKDYNIFVFDEKLNHINRFNVRYDGTKYNNKFSGSYLLSKSKNPFQESYDLVYHIFLNSYTTFNKYYKFPQENQFIHLYPGGGFSSQNLNFDKEVKVISTHPLTSKLLEENSINYIECLFGPLEIEGIHRKTFEDKKITVCFSTLGNSKDKGDDEYYRISKIYKNKYPTDTVEFISIGNYKGGGVSIPPCDYRTLSHIYRNWVDIYLNLETGKSYNGWPLGLEAACQGCIIITTDSMNSRRLYKMDDDIFPICNTVEEFIEKIHELINDRNKMNYLSEATKNYLEKHLTKSNQQERVLDFMRRYNNQNIKILEFL